MLYQFRDWESYRYDLWQLKGVGYLRGPDPRPLPPGGYVSYFGTAHTFGRFCNRPYPDQLRRHCGIPGIDLSTSSVGPRYFTMKPALLEIANAGRACVIQAPSARSCSNSMYHNHNTGNNVFQPTGSAENSPRIHEGQIFNPLFAQGRIDEAARLAAEMKLTWVEEMKTLLGAVTTPKILLWFSSRTPAYRPGRATWASMCGAFPQLVDNQMIEEIRPLADAYVEVVSRSGLPIEFYNRFTGGRGRCYFGKVYRGDHAYYPSDEMQVEAADALEPVLAGYFSDEEREAAQANPSPHARMIDLAETAWEEPGEADPFAPVQMFEALNALLAQEGVDGRVETVGTLDPYAAGLADALAAAPSDREFVRLMVVGEVDKAAELALEAAADQLLAGGVAVVLDAARADRAAVVKRLHAVHELEIAAFVDGAAMMTPAANVKPVSSWLHSALREVTVPQFRLKRLRYADHGYPRFESRARSDFHIDHAKFG